MNEFQKRIDEISCPSASMIDDGFEIVVEAKLEFEKIVESAKKDLGEVIQKPKRSDYELTIPYHRAQYAEDLERWKRFEKWFMDSADEAEDAEK